MLIDASHREETRVVVLDGNRVEEFDFEAASKRPLKGNIYLAKVTRVEPSLQAAFVEYGGNRQGFLAFSEIHPDYYQIPVADRMAILAAHSERAMADEEEGIDSVDVEMVPAKKPVLDEQAEGDEVADDSNGEAEAVEGTDEAVGERPSEPEQNGETHEEAVAEATAPATNVATDAALSDETGGDADTQKPDEQPPSTEPEVVVRTESTGAPHSHRRRDQSDRPRPPRRRQYKIQEVIKRRQVMLVQVVKEERGNKGASLTTFLSLAGRYCVLMPNTPRGGGISRKITSATDRKRLKAAAQSLELPEGMGLIIRTAGANRTKLEIKRDYEYLLRLWDTVRELTLKSNAPALVYEEGSLIKRAIRDLYNKDTSEILVDGEAGYRDAKDFMRMLMPSHAKNVKLYKEALPLFQRYQVESQLDAMFSPVVTLRSGGYIVINQTEALVAIDVNSGRATREHSIEETAYKTNLEAADEIARQLRLRDLAGLVVIDFIDMEDLKNDRNVEKRLHNAVRGDRARIQIGKISQFGLMEMSRQRLRAGVVAGSTVTCPHCNGQGIIRSTESAALRLLRALDEEGQRAPSGNLTIKAPPDVTIYTLNQKRREVARIEEAYNLGITFEPTPTMMGGNFELERTGQRVPVARPAATPISVEAGFREAQPEEQEAEEVEPEAVADAPKASAPARPHEAAGPTEGDGHGGRRRRRRRRRGGRGRNGQPHPQHLQEGQPAQHEPRAVESAEPQDNGSDDGESDDHPGADAAGEQTVPAEGSAPPPAEGGGGGRRRRRRRGRRGRRHEGEFGNSGHRTPAAQTEIQSSVLEPAPHHARDDSARPEPIEPNAPSSPQWSLGEPHKDVPVASLEREVERPQDDLVRAHVSETVASTETVESESEGPREARKGWWQRRFKM
jgi:ribonuclease E